MHELELSSAALASSRASGGAVPLSATSGSSDGYSPKMTSNGIRYENKYRVTNGGEIDFS